MYREPDAKLFGGLNRRFANRDVVRLQSRRRVGNATAYVFAVGAISYGDSAGLVELVIEDDPGVAPTVAQDETKMLGLGASPLLGYGVTYLSRWPRETQWLCGSDMPLRERYLPLGPPYENWPYGMLGHMFAPVAPPKIRASRFTKFSEFVGYLKSAISSMDGKFVKPSHFRGKTHNADRHVPAIADMQRYRSRRKKSKKK